ncbi:AraC family transcriptional regulator [Rhizobium sp. R635]|uniref:helix-turn-helix transcriptional regulator n=1 Tax=Rhizobium sp. R635 TaxID=1764275 RepID=UPI000B52F916|nr:AraC family transcriptional regulator [Rhizobium sp. R635]OWV80409.1 AraC family transcriptional regulator [Rhizobium sp. R635]
MADDQGLPFTFQYGGSSFDNMIETLGGAFGTFTAEPARRSREFSWGIDLAVSDRTILVRGSHQDQFTFRVEPISETAQYLCVIVPRNGGMGITRSSRCGQACSNRLLLYTNYEAGEVAMYGQNSLIDELLIDWSIIRQTVAQIFERPLDGSLEFLFELDGTTAAGATIKGLAETIIDGMSGAGLLMRSPIAMANLTQTMADLVVRQVPHRLTPFLGKKVHMIAPRHVRRAIEFMHENIDQPITMALVAEFVGVSTRALEIGFRMFKYTSPAGYLQALRLQAVRRDLLDPANDESVKSVCLKWGFFHFGRFSAVYASAYGEKPSETRLRSRALR